MVRIPFYASQFYPKDTAELQKSMDNFFAQAQTAIARQEKNSGLPSPGSPVQKQYTRICMLPHAGHIYSGAVTAQTLAQTELPRTLIILCPNHTGMGKHGAIWDNGTFLTPFGPVNIAEDTAEKLLRNSCFTADRMAHIKEHSVEVILPFLQYLYGEELRIVPISLASMQHLDSIIKALTQCMREDENTGIIISSDMNHYAPEKLNRQKDFMALEAIKAMDENLLFATVRENNISMCGILGVYAGIAAAKALGLHECRIAGYDTSATASGDSSKVVGYAGLYFI